MKEETLRRADGQAWEPLNELHRLASGYSETFQKEEPEPSEVVDECFAAFAEALRLTRECASLTAKLAEAEEREKRLRSALEDSTSLLEMARDTDMDEEGMVAEQLRENRSALSPPAKTGGGG